MSADQNELDAFLRDFRKYLKQQEMGGQAWYYAEPAPAAAPDQPDAATDSPAAAPAPNARQAGPEPTAAPSASQPATAAPTPAPPSPSAQTPPRGAAEAEKNQEFAAACAGFVAATLAQIQRHKETVPEQGDIFGEAVETPATLDLEARTAALAELEAEVAVCRQCKLAEGRTQTVFGSGRADAGVLLIGEAPGAEEDRQGLPFVGRSGQLLTEILKAIGFARDEVYICNILKCRPPGNRDPEADEVQACESYLRRQLEIIEPRVILCLGRTAAQTLLGTRASLSQLRETVHFYAGIPVMATFHPAALLRNPHWKRPTWDDVRKLRALHDALPD